VLGSPARSIGAVCKCGQLFHKFVDGESGSFECICGLEYLIVDRIVTETSFTTENTEVTEDVSKIAFA